MATLGSVRKAQIPIACRVCDNANITWKCNDCDYFMCHDCKENIHPRLKLADEHDVISVQDINSTPYTSNLSSEVVVSVFNSYKTSVVGIHSLLCADDDIVYFICNLPGSSQFVKAKLLKASLRKLQSNEKRWFDITLNNEGEILFTDPWKDNKLYLWLNSGEAKPVLDGSPIMLLSLHTNIHENELIVGIREQGEPFPVTEFSVRQVIIFDGGNLKRKRTLEFDSIGNKLFCYPARITTDSKNVMYIVDWINDRQDARIVATNRYGKVKFIYNGHEKYDRFLPLGITTTPSDNIIVTDSINDALHVLNRNGELIAFQILTELNVYRPACICVDSEGYLLIGCLGLSEEETAKLHVLKPSENIM